MPRRPYRRCGRRRARPRVGNRARRRSSPLTDASKLPVPSQSSFLLLGARRAELERAAPSETAAARRTGKSSPPQLDSLRSNILHLAPKLVQPSTNATVPYPGRNRAQTAARHRRPPSSSAPSFALTSTTPFRPSSAQNRSTVSPAATLAHSPTLSLSESALRRPRIAAAPPQNAPSAARAAAGSPWAPPLAAAARPRAAVPSRGSRSPLPPPPSFAAAGTPRAARADPAPPLLPACAAASRRSSPLRRLAPPGAGPAAGMPWPRPGWPPPPASCGLAAAPPPRPRRPAPWRSRAGKSRGGGGPGSLTGGARLSAPPFIVFHFLF